MISRAVLPIPIALLFAVLGIVAKAQLVAPQLKTITMRDGLSSDHAQCMAVDARGYLWIGTSDGLNRYDGRQVKVYRTGEAHGLPSDYITSLVLSGDGLLYIGTSAPYLTILDPLADTLSNIPLPIPAYSQHGEQRVNRLHIDRKRRIWVAHGARCLSLFEPSTRGYRTTEIAPPLPSPRSREAILGIHEDAQGILWLATFRGLVRFDPESATATPIDLHPAPGMRGEGYALQIRGAVDEDSCLVFGTWSEGIFRMRKRDGEVRLLWPSPTHKPTFVDHMVQDMLLAPDGFVYVATIDQGLLRLNTRTDEVEHFDRSLLEEACRSGKDLWTGAARLLWHDDALYIGSYTQGVAIWPFGVDPISATQLPPHPIAEETDEVFHALRDPRNGTITALSHRRGLFVYDSTGSHLIRRIHLPDPKRRYYAMLRLDDERLLIASAPSSFIVSPTTGSITSPTFLQKAKPCAGMLWWARGDGSHGLWCHPGQGGLQHVDTVSGRCVAVHDSLPELQAMLGTWPWDVHVDPLGRTWFLSATASPAVLHPDGHIERVRGPASLAPFEVSDMAIAPDGRIWMAVKHTGLASLPPGSLDVQAVEDNSSLLPSRNIEGLACMRDGTLWLTLPNALVHYDPASRTSRTITVVDGLPSGPLNLSSSHEPLQAPLVVGTWEGFFSVIPESPDASRAPYVQIPLVLAHDSIVARNADLHSADDLVLPHSLDRVSFLLRSTDLNDQDRNEFSYRLVGSDTNWTTVLGADRVTFNRLAPGRYRFEARARSHDGAWGNPSTVDLVILPPFWATWWFRGILVLLLATAAWLIFRWILRARLRRQRQQLERERALLEERMRIAHDLHDDLGSSLALIAMEGEMARMGGGADAREALQRVSEGAREVTDNMRRIVWALSSGQETLGDLAAYIRSSAAELMERTELRLETAVSIKDPSIRLSADQRRHLLLITKELLLNVVKHARARTVHLEIEQADQHLRISIRDDGIGFDTEERTGAGTGTTSLFGRAKALGGHMVLNSAPGRGTTVSLSVPLARETV